ncbi:hypothetical protein [Rossellomorea aquimaris]|uniref:hypothetical protein n=1 Tax=Rossellomorea aquimaris TaxID=189382 RepID=UPI0011E92881|nr:hypothetical protein [Rossellomorea aquimaris]TYS91574.1 hypothetical protein FZC88_05365 [Rossellomorea aquimaris]
MKKLMAVGLVLLLMTGCMNVETSEEESKAAPPKVEEKAEKTEPKAPKDNTADYDKAVANMLSGLSTTMSDFSQTLIEGSSDPLLMVSAEYQQDLQYICDKLYTDIQEFKSLDIPADRKELHDRLLDALSHFEIVATDTPGAVENLDANRLTELTGDMTVGNEKLVDLTNDLSEMMQ